nr:bifunctional phosphoribosylaminoimidazolecarboxamide formyltransferase/IMP cyclohydrolase [Nitrosomonas sp.]
MIKQALISVSNKVGVVDLARALHQRGIKIISSGGTAKLLQENAIPVTEVSDYTGFPEMLDGRVKTLHPKIHAGILSRMDLDAHRQAIQQVGIDPIELVVVNLYPFVETINRAGCTLADAIENIDIGGPTLIRAAAKNYQHVTVITEPEDYSVLLAELDHGSGAVSDSRRFYFAQKAFTHTARYDSAISNYLTAIDADGQHTTFPEHLNLN